MAKKKEEKQEETPEKEFDFPAIDAGESIFTKLLSAKDSEDQPKAVSAVPMDMFDYMPTVDDIQLPRIRLAQGLTPEVMSAEARPGDWLVPGHEAQSTLTVTILGIRRTRAKWEREDPNDPSSPSSVVCSSNDAIAGVGTPGGDCGTCEFSQWSRDAASGKNRPPSCTLSYEYLVQTADGEVCVYSASTKSANQAISQLNTFFKQYGSGNMVVVLASQVVTKGNRRYCIPVVQKVTHA